MWGLDGFHSTNGQATTHHKERSKGPNLKKSQFLPSLSLAQALRLEGAAGARGDSGSDSAAADDSAAVHERPAAVLAELGKQNANPRGGEPMARATR